MYILPYIYICIYTSIYIYPLKTSPLIMQSSLVVTLLESVWFAMKSQFMTHHRKHSLAGWMMKSTAKDVMKKTKELDVPHLNVSLHSLTILLCIYIYIYIYVYMHTHMFPPWLYVYYVYMYVYLQSIYLYLNNICIRTCSHFWTYPTYIE